MAENNVDMAQAPITAIYVGNTGDAHGNEKAMNTAPKAPTPLMGDSLDIIGSFDHLHPDPLAGGNMWQCSPQSIFPRLRDHWAPFRDHRLASPRRDQEADPVPHRVRAPTPQPRNASLSHRLGTHPYPRGALRRPSSMPCCAPRRQPRLNSTCHAENCR